jgi:WD40 repeat protein
MKADFFNHAHPNCLAFSDSGRLFAGSSDGVISAWDVDMKDGEIRAENHFKIAHRELDGD